VAIVWGGPFSIEEAENSLGPRISYHVWDDADSNGGTTVSIISGGDKFEDYYGVLRLKAEYLENYQGFETDLVGGNIYQITLRAVHRAYDWDTDTYTVTEGQQTYSVRVTDQGPGVAEVDYEVTGAIREDATNGDLVTSIHGNGFVFNRGSDGAGKNSVQLLDNAGGRFYLEQDGDNFYLKVADASLLDRDDASSYNVSIAFSDGTTTVVQNHVISLQNADPSAPVDVNTGSNSVLEHAAAGTTVGITAQSADANGGTLSYALANNYGGALAIDAATGIVTVADSSKLNFETLGSSLLLGVIATDGVGATTRSDFTLSLSDRNEAPIVTGLGEYFYEENNAENLISTGAYDVDRSPVWNTLSYSLSGDDAKFFTIDQDGYVRLKNPLDFEAHADKDGDNVYEASVTVSDGQLSTTKSFSVAVSDVNEGPVIPGGAEITIKVAEGTSGFTQIHQFMAVDPEGDDISYSIQGPGSDSYHFMIDADGTLLLSSTASYDNPTDDDGDHIYEFDLVAYDGHHQVVQHVNVEIEEAQFAPVISNYNGGETGFRRIDENWQYAVDYFQAIDADGDAIGWSISGVDAGKFTIDTNGALRLKTPADFENPTDANKDNIYEVTVIASDGTKSDSIDMQVKIDDLPDGGVSSNVAISSNGGGATAGIDTEEGRKTVTTVIAAGNNGNLTYSLVDYGDDDDFVIDSETGKLSFKSTPDFERPADSNKDNSYTVRVQATDGTTTDTQTLTVKVEDKNEAPVITSDGSASTATKTVKENVKTVTTVLATDPDKDGVTYSIVSGGDSGDFTINSKTGVLSFRSAPNFEKPADGNKDNTYSVKVKASDGSLEDTQTITVKITDVKAKNLTDNNDPHTLEGTSEGDTLRGKGGNDRLFGLGGADTLEGGYGADKLYGGENDGARDIFVFRRFETGITSETMDRVYDFVSGTDRIDLSTIDGDLDKSGFQHLRYENSLSKPSGSEAEGQFIIKTGSTISTIHIDYNGDNKVDGIIWVDDQISKADILF
jgi:hypothetical protein